MYEEEVAGYPGQTLAECPECHLKYLMISGLAVSEN